MLKDFDLIRRTFPKADTMDIYPIADAHLGAIEHCEAEWQNFLKAVEQSNAYLILAGDLLNNNTRSVKFANPFDEAMRPMEAKLRMVEYLEPLKDRILCLTDGNHEQRTKRESDQSLTYDIACKLGIEEYYRENVCFMAVSLGTKNKGKNTDGYRNTYTFVVTHGNFGGALTGGMVNANERFGGIIEGLDVLITGHAHRGAVTKPQKIVIDPHNNTVKLKHYTAVSCVSWLNYGGYAARKMLPPSQVCDPQKIRLDYGRHDWNKRIITTW